MPITLPIKDQPCSSTDCETDLTQTWQEFGRLAPGSDTGLWGPIPGRGELRSALRFGEVSTTSKTCRGNTINKMNKKARNTKFRHTHTHTHTHHQTAVQHNNSE